MFSLEEICGVASILNLLKDKSACWYQRQRWPWPEQVRLVLHVFLLYLLLCYQHKLERAS